MVQRVCACGLDVLEGEWQVGMGSQGVRSRWFERGHRTPSRRCRTQAFALPGPRRPKTRRGPRSRSSAPAASDFLSSAAASCVKKGLPISRLPVGFDRARERHGQGLCAVRRTRSGQTNDRGEGTQASREACLLRRGDAAQYGHAPVCNGHGLMPF